MASAVIPEQRVILHDVSWETYERLLAEQGESRGTRFAYDGGSLEIMVVSAGHETPNQKLALLVHVVASESRIDYHGLGSTTFKRQDLLKGFEPDCSFYFTDPGRMRGVDEVDPVADPPELAVEVDITRTSLNRFPIFAAFGVKEVWRWSSDQLAMYRLSASQYVAIESSVFLPVLTAEAATRFLLDSRRQPIGDWEKSVRQWVGSRR